MQTSTSVPGRGARRTLPSRHCGTHSGGDEGLVRVACTGSVETVGRCGPRREHAFLPYAVPTVAGKVRRHVRDCAGGLRGLRARWDEHRPRADQVPPRRSGHGHGGRPAGPERAAGTALEDVRPALGAKRALRPAPLDEERGSGRAGPRAETPGAWEPAPDPATERVAPRAGPRALPARERRVPGPSFPEPPTRWRVARAVGPARTHMSRPAAPSCARPRDRRVWRCGAPPARGRRLGRRATAAPHRRCLFSPTGGRPLPRFPPRNPR
ncbi:RNA polymerase subunit sigma [Streptomyces sp. NPDC056160]|uniref:RNA polymerase subunit sigma n=1 Tax=Streptomyces sp. NPDC056160 TaxID=3345731 RepID=UPI0035DD4AA2